MSRLSTVLAASAVSLFALAVCCGWPNYAVKATPADGGVDEGGPEDTAPYETSSVACDDAGVKSGQAVECSCATGDAGDDTGEAAVAYQACNLEGGLGSCIGCPTDNGCDTATAPMGMTCIAGGVVTLGATNKNVCPPDGCPTEMPEHKVAISRFFLDEREVTVKRFRDWWTNGHVAPSKGQEIFVAADGTAVKWSDAWAVSEPLRSDGMNGATWLGPDDATNDALPVSGVDWPTAVAFCVTNGMRLPTEAEFEAAASGRAGRIFPRENPDTRNDAPTAAMLPCNRAISGAGGADCGTPSAPAPTSERLSFDGAYDLAGNLAEWVLDVPPAGSFSCTSCYPGGPTADPVLFVDGVARRVVRGGSWMDTAPAKLRAQARDFQDLATKSAAVGFRCARR